MFVHKCVEMLNEAKQLRPRSEGRGQGRKLEAEAKKH